MRALLRFSPGVFVVVDALHDEQVVVIGHAPDLLDPTSRAGEGLLPVYQLRRVRRSESARARQFVLRGVALVLQPSHRHGTQHDRR